MRTVRLLAAAVVAAAALSTTACTIDPTFGAGSGSSNGSSNGSSGPGGGAGSDAGGAELPDPSALEDALQELEDALDTSGGGSGSESGGSDQPQGDPVIDACMLLTDDEITEITGPHSGGKRAVAAGDPEPDGSWCSYENPETYHSVTIRIGDENTTADGELPEISDYGTTEPGPDGIRLATGGIAEFALGTRLCDVQVVTDPTDDTGDHQTAIMFIGMIRDRV